MTKPPQRVGMLGLGLMGTRMAKAMQKHGGFVLQSAFDAEPERTQSWAAEFGCQPHRSASEVIEDGKVDWIYIATPPASHADLAIAAMRAGKPILLEKPLAASTQDAQRMIDAMEEENALACMHFPFATLPGLGRMRRELASGRVGLIRQVTIELHFSQWPRTWHHAGPWLAGSQEGGFCREVFSHFAYLTQTLLGPLVVEQKKIARGPGGTEEMVHAMFRAGEVPINLVADVSGGSPDFNRWVLHGEHQSFQVCNWSSVSFATKDDCQTHTLEPGESPGIEASLDHWQQALTGTKHPLATLADGLGVLHTVESLLAE